MRLQAFDDYPFHQHPAPFAQPATTDAKHNDGYFMAFYGPDWYFVAVLRLHPNVNTIDGAACVTRAGVQHCMRASRALRPRSDELAVGPLTLELLEPMRRQRLTLADNPSGIRFDVVFDAQSPPFVEDRYQHYKYGAIVNDTVRYTQVCRVDGTAALGDERLTLDGWHGMRDHSWGVRTSIGPATGIGGVQRLPEEADERAFRIWVPFQAGDHCGFFHTHEDRTGRTLDFEGRLDYADGRAVALRSVTHALRYAPGSKRPIGGSIALIDEHGATHRYELTASGAGADVQGLGYYRGWEDGASAGIYRGPEHLEVGSYPLETDEPSGPAHVPVPRRLGPTEFPCVIAGPGGDGMAHLEHHVFGPYDPYGFTAR